MQVSPKWGRQFEKHQVMVMMKESKLSTSCSHQFLPPQRSIKYKKCDELSTKGQQRYKIQNQDDYTHYGPK